MDDVFDEAPRADKAKLKALSARSDAKGLWQLGTHLAALVLSGLFVTWAIGSLWMVPALCLHGLLLTFLFAPLHETVHRTAFKSRWLNDVVAKLCGFLLLLPAEYFRAFHFTHHRYTQDPARDPELAVPKPASLGAYLLLMSGLPYWRERTTTILRQALGDVTSDFIAPQKRAEIRREARLYVACYAAAIAASLATGSPAILVYWLIPALLGQPALRAYLLAEHGGCPLIPDMLRNSRTTRSNALVRRLAWNMPYHAEHHAYPALPFHALPQAHAVLKERIAVKASGYTAVHAELLRARRSRADALPNQG